MELCYNFRSNHSFWKGGPSYICDGCLKFKPIRDEKESLRSKYILNIGCVNCQNFKPKGVKK